ncbi:MAG: TrmH family RNA methyltransferase [Candidatus Zambryskibacteria bacterium]|nr:TrmH family RNA methyltransferase [Candidatus Zambryskibacteria bacterium]
MSKSQAQNIIVILNNIRSSENVGSIFRTCDATSVSKIILCGYTPAPIDCFGRENKKLTKAALGAEKTVEWEKEESLEVASLKVKKLGYKIIGIEQDKNAINYQGLKSKLLTRNPKPALVFGNEIEGLSKEDLKLCDIIAELPMLGAKESLNVSVCAGIVLYSLITNYINN